MGKPKICRRRGKTFIYFICFTLISVYYSIKMIIEIIFYAVRIPPYTSKMNYMKNILFCCENHLSTSNDAHVGCKLDVRYRWHDLVNHDVRITKNIDRRIYDFAFNGNVFDVVLCDVMRQMQHAIILKGFLSDHPQLTHSRQSSQTEYFTRVYVVFNNLDFSNHLLWSCNERKKFKNRKFRNFFFINQCKMCSKPCKFLTI